MTKRVVYLFCAIVLTNVCLLFSQNNGGWIINENLKYSIDGRMVMDGGLFFHSDDKHLKYNNELLGVSKDFAVTDAMLGISAEIYKKWNAKMDIAFSTNGNISIRDFYIKYDINGSNSIYLGNMQNPIMLSYLTSSRFANMERPLPVDYLNEGRRIGLAWEYSNKNHYANINFNFADVRGHSFTSKFEGNDLGLCFRYAYRYALGSDVIHFGLYNSTRGYVNKSDDIANNYYSLTGVRNFNINEVLIQGVRNTNIGGLEFLSNLNRLRVQGEAMYKHINQNDTSKGRWLYGGYINVAYSLFENNSMSYNYQKACLKRNDNKPLELFAQASYLNLDDISDSKCDVFSSTLGATWYPNRFILCSLFYDCTLYRNGINKKYSWDGSFLPIHSINARINVYF